MLAEARREEVLALTIPLPQTEPLITDDTFHAQSPDPFQAFSSTTKANFNIPAFDLSRSIFSSPFLT